jgi:hypothetical protein
VGRARWVRHNSRFHFPQPDYKSPVFAAFYSGRIPQRGFTGSNTYRNLFGGTAGIQNDAKAAIGTFSPTQTNFGSVSPIDRHLQNPQVQQWNLTIERQVTPSLAVKAGYVGNVGHHLLRARRLNMIPQGTIQPASDAADEIARLPQFQSVFSGESAALNGSSNRIDPRFNLVTITESSWNSNYNALEVQILKRYSKGYQFQVSYTYSKSIDDQSDALNVNVNDLPNAQNPFNLHDNRAISQFDIPHRLVINHIYQPQLFKNMGGIGGRLLHGWEFNGIQEIQSNIFVGSRLGIADTSLTGNGTGTNVVRPDVVGDLSK